MVGLYHVLFQEMEHLILKTLLVTDKNEVYAEMDLDKPDRVAVPAGYSILAPAMVEKLQVATKTASEAGMFAALALTDGRGK